MVILCTIVPIKEVADEATHWHRNFISILTVRQAELGPSIIYRVEAVTNSFRRLEIKIFFFDIDILVNVTDI